MIRGKTLFVFLLKALIIYCLLAAPISLFDKAYGSFYRKVAGMFFDKFEKTGFVKLSEWKRPDMTRVYIGNYTMTRPDGTAPAASVDVNTRYTGYLPTILLISLVLASPVPWKRKLTALSFGLILITLLIMFKQWIALLWYCEEKSWLHLTNFTVTGKKLLTFANNFIAVSAGTVLYFVAVIWLLVTFRMDDFKSLTKKQQITS